MPQKAKDSQISFREENDTVDRIRRCARREDLKVADFVRKVFRYGFRSYETVGSLYELTLSERAGTGSEGSPGEWLSQPHRLAREQAEVAREVHKTRGDTGHAAKRKVGPGSESKKLSNDR